MTELTASLQWSLENKVCLQTLESLSQKLSGKDWLSMEMEIYILLVELPHSTPLISPEPVLQHWGSQCSSGAGVLHCLHSSPFWAHLPSGRFKEVNILWSMSVRERQCFFLEALYFIRTAMQLQKKKNKIGRNRLAWKPSSLPSFTLIQILQPPSLDMWTFKEFAEFADLTLPWHNSSHSACNNIHLKETLPSKPSLPAKLTSPAETAKFPQDGDKVIHRKPVPSRLAVSSPKPKSPRGFSRHLSSWLWRTSLPLTAWPIHKILPALLPCTRLGPA